MSPKNDKAPRYDSAFTAYVSLIADSKWASRRALNLWLSASNWRTAVIRKLQDSGFATCIDLNEKNKNKKRRKRRKMREEREVTGNVIGFDEEEVPSYIYGARYALTKKGREYLGEFNARRYGGATNLALETNEYDPRRVYRLSLLSEMRAMNELAGYSVHNHAKPHITILSNHPITLADRPAFTAFTTTKYPERYIGNENSYFNQGTFQYYEQATKRKSYGYEHFDARPYSFRETPIGCVYTLPELMALAESETEYIGGNKEATDKMRYCRISGVFFSGHGGYRLYNTERTAPRIRVNGENYLKIVLNAWSANIYKQSLTDMIDDGSGNPSLKPVTPDLRGAILFGDATHKAAISVLKQSGQSKSTFGKRIKEKEREIQNYNLSLVPDTYFIPVIQEAIPLYSVMIYPHWPYWIQKMGKDYLGTLNAERSEAPSLTRSFIDDTFPHGTLDDGSALLILISLHLDSVYKMIEELEVSDTRFTVLAMEWQKPFFDALAGELEPEVAEKLSLIYIPQSYLTDFADWLHKEQENPYYTND